MIKEIKSMDKNTESGNAKPKDYVVITPEGKEISVEEYMETDHFVNKIEQQLDSYLTNDVDES